MIDLAGLWVFYSVIGSELVGIASNFILSDWSLSSTADSLTVQLWRFLGIGGLFGAIGLFIVAAFLRTLRATPGQRLIGVLTVDSGSGVRLGWPQALGRSLMLYGPWMAILVVPPQFVFGFDILDLEPTLGWVPALPWVIRALALGWYAVLVATTSSAADGRGFHDLSSRSVVVGRVP